MKEKEKHLSSLGETANEQAFVANSSGEVLLEKGGGKSTVRFESHEVDRLRSDGNAIFTHNHPNQSSFSVTDFEFATSANLKEIRAVTSKGTHIATRPASGWPGKEKISEEWTSRQNHVRNLSKIQVMQGKFENLKAAHLWQRTETVKRFSAKLGIGYRYEPHG